MDINWTAVSAIGTITSSLLGLVALLISLRNKRNEERRSRPLLTLEPYYVQGSDYLFFIVSNLSHVDVKIIDYDISFWSLLKSNKASRLNRFLIKLAQYLPFKLVHTKTVYSNVMRNEKYPDMFRFCIGGVRVNEKFSITDAYNKDMPELLEAHGDMNVAIKKADILMLSNDLSKYGCHLFFGICFTCSNGIRFVSKLIRLDKIK